MYEKIQKNPVNLEEFCKFIDNYNELCLVLDNLSFENSTNQAFVYLIQ